MARYADPTRCPDCAAPLPSQPVACPRCALPVRGPLADSLLATLRHADDLVAALRAGADRGREPASVGAGAGSRAGDPSSADRGQAVQRPRVSPASFPVFPAASRPAAGSTSGSAAGRTAGRTAGRSRGLRGSSVPVLLLSLGALCLLVAAVIFLAVAWSWLGLGGRTLVLLTLTGTAGGLAVGLGRRGLRVAGEALSVVTLGMVLLDVAGAVTAGWVTADSVRAGSLWAGFPLLAAGLALGLAVPRALHAPQLAVGVAWSLIWVGLLAPGECLAMLLLAGVVVSMLAAVLTRRCHLTTATVTLLTTAALGWLALLATGLGDALSAASFGGVWREGAGAGLAGAAVVAAGVAALGHRVAAWRDGAGAVAALVTTALVCVPAVDEGATVAGLTGVGVVVVWSALGVPAGRVGLARAAVAPLLAPVPLLLVLAVDQLTAAAEAVLTVGAAWEAPWTVRIDPSPTAAAPVLLVPMVTASALALLVSFLLLTGRPAGSRGRGTARAAAAAPPLVSALATIALFPAPVALLVGGLAACGAGGLLTVLRCAEARALPLATGCWGVLAAAVIVASPSSVLTLAAVSVLAAVAGIAVRWGRFPSAADLGGATLPVALGGVLWTTGEVASVAESGRGVPVLLLVGSLALLRPRWSVESSAGLAALAATAFSVVAAERPLPLLALHLTLAGALVGVSALVHPHRRAAGYLAGVLLADASWVRLADLGVGHPEAYTLPAAVALVVVGLVALRRDPDLPTGRALGGGLALATVPSLLWVVDDPMSPRALLLGAATLALLLAGGALRWAAPLVVGGAVGTLLVLRELAPWVGETPQWVLIGGAGALLLCVGVTWEARARDLRRAAAYVGRLR